MSATTPETGTLSRETNWWGAFVIGLAGTILIIGLVGFALVALGGASIPLFAILTAVGVVLCFCLAELAAMMPDRAGGLPSYAFETFRPLGDWWGTHVGGLSSWAYWLGWFTVAPINAILAANYIIALFGINAGSSHTFGPISNGFGAQVSVTQFIVGALILLVMFIPCLLGIRLGATFASVLGIASMIPLVLLVFLPFVHPSKIDFGRLDGFGLPAGVNGSWQLIIGWAFIFTWSVLAMEAAACYIGECRDPARDAKIAMTAEGLFGFFIYVSIPIMVLAVLGSGVISKQSGDAQELFISYTNALFGSSGFWKWFVGLVLILALMLSVINAIAGCARGLWQNSHDGVLPRWFGHVNRHGVPDWAMIFNVVCSTLVLLIGSPLQIYVFSNMGYLFALAVSLIGYSIYRARRPDLARPVRMPNWMGPLAMLLGIGLLAIWAVGGYLSPKYVVGTNQQWLWYVGLLLLVLYVPLYMWRMAEDKRLGHTSYTHEGVSAEKLAE
ncbi:MAG TPA: APC family permease [Gaiellales bacterium]|jgi:amino acid transporter|nr:APC family permease [Gaiellales bacterium]